MKRFERATSHASATRARGYAPTIKTKIDFTDGKHSLHCWGADGNLIDAPEFRISPQIHVSHVWLMGTNFGPVLRLTDALLKPEEDAPASLKRKSPL